MKGVWENKWFAVPVLIFLVACTLLLFVVPYGDEILFFNKWREEPYNSIFRICTAFGEGFVYGAIILAAFRWRYRFSLLIALSGMLILPVGYVLKDKIAVERPKTFFEHKGIYGDVVVVPDVKLNSGRTSFPSGHTMSAFALYSMLTLIMGRRYERWGLFFALLAILVAISRIFLVQHFLADILAGAVAGLACAQFLWWLNGRPFFQRLTVLDKGIRKKREARSEK
ncbi:MAG TPA: phosphatase PAP2 family protein [Saprospiraceae bacterium]|nr:phosphatase PAP2 family protein [Saprospiraceae bacterium]HPI06850.1 phosphatase PAP2 family protein [Saprospiraceae bacterium]